MLGYPKFLIGWMLLLGVGVLLLPVGTSAQSVTVEVPANVAWTDTGITVDKGQVIEFRATGSWSFDPQGSGMHGPEGVTAVKNAGPGFPVPSQPPGVLLVKVGNRIRGIGSHAQLKMDQSGQLFLGINDAGLDDNQGTVVVTMTTRGGRVLDTQATSQIPKAPDTVFPKTARTVTVDVPANVAWTDTGLTVTAGEVLEFRATGLWSFDPRGSGMHGPDGITTITRAGTGFPLPPQPPGRLLARIGNQIRPVGSYTQLEMPGSGQLFLGINDSGLADNQGVLSVTITPLGDASFRQVTTPAYTTTRDITIHVQDSTGRPLVGYWVKVHTPAAAGSQEMGEGQTDQQGNYTLSLPEGEYRVSVYEPEGDERVYYESFLVPTRRGGNVETVTVKETDLERDQYSKSQATGNVTTVTVHLQDQRQRPLAGYQISVYAVPGGQKVGEGQTDRQGNFAITLPEGRYRASLSRDGQVLSRQFQVPNPRGDNHYTITLGRGARNRG